jgi:hypothetical protein
MPGFSAVSKPFEPNPHAILRLKLDQIFPRIAKLRSQRRPVELNSGFCFFCTSPLCIVGSMAGTSFDSVRDSHGRSLAGMKSIRSATLYM